MAYLSNTGLTKLVELINTKFETKAALGTAAYQDTSHFALASHGNHVPAKQTASNKVFLRNDNTWQTITPANIGALATTGTAADSSKLGGTAASSYALKTYVDSKVADLVNSAPATLDTLAELSAALGNDPNFATTIATQIGGKVATDSADYIKSASVSGKTLTLTKGDDTTVAFTETNTTYSAGSGLSLSGTTFNHASTITAGTAGTSTATSGITLAVPYVTYNATGHVTAAGTHTHTVPNMTAASASAAGAAGLVPAPAKGDQTKFLRADGTWQAANNYSHPNSGATAGSYGPSDNASPAHSGTFSVPYVTINAQGHVTAASTKTITLPADNDTKNTAGSTNSTAKLFLVGAASQAANPQTYSSSKVYETDGALVATSFAGSGASLTALNASNISSGTLAAARLATSGATAGSYGESADKAPGYAGTFNIPYVTVDTYGRVTAIANKKITLPSADNTDTKNTAGSTNSTSKLFLIGATSQAANPTTNSHSAVYETAGVLNATSYKVNEHGTIQYNAATGCIELLCA